MIRMIPSMRGPLRCWCTGGPGLQASLPGRGLGLCSSSSVANSRAPPHISHCRNPHHSKYYLVIVQVIAQFYQLNSWVLSCIK